MKPDKSLLSVHRSEKARGADKLAEELVLQRQRVFRVTLFIIIIAEAAFWYFELGLWVRIVLPLIWIGFLVHNNAMLVLHELWELNDQIAGRKDEFRGVVSPPPDRERD